MVFSQKAMCGLQPKVRTTRPQAPSKSPPSLLIASADLECHHPSSWSESVGIIRSKWPRCYPTPSLCLAFLPFCVRHGLGLNPILIYGATFTRACTMAPICSLGRSVSPLGRKENTLSSRLSPLGRRNSFTLTFGRGMSLRPIIGCL